MEIDAGQVRRIPCIVVAERGFLTCPTRGSERRNVANKNHPLLVVLKDFATHIPARAGAKNTVDRGILAKQVSDLASTTWSCLGWRQIDYDGISDAPEFRKINVPRRAHDCRANAGIVAILSAGRMA